jgi:two-component system LytT family response regulator
MVVRALIVEDEPLARRTLRDFATEMEWLILVGEAEDGRSAVSLIDSLRPDLVLLDVQMPEFSGMEVLKRIKHQPWIIFTTAYDSYAVTAFELEALDYLLKPFGHDRFQSAMERVRDRLEDTNTGQSTVRERAISSLQSSGPLSRLFVREGNHIVPIKLDQISRFEAEDDYLRVHARGRSHLIHLTLNEIEARLDQTIFCRVHRSIIVNLEHVERFEPHDRRLLLRLKDGATVIASRAYSQSLRKLIF